MVEQQSSESDHIGISSQLPSPYVHLQAHLQTDVAWRASNLLLRDAFGFARCPEFRPLVRELPPRSLFVPHAGVNRLGIGQPSCCRQVELAVPRDIISWHLIGNGKKQLRA